MKEDEGQYVSNTGYNKIQNFPEDIVNLCPKLKPEKVLFMKIENQNISKLEDYALNEFVKLQQLDLSNNKITKLSDNSFDGLKNLEMLELDGNNISVIEEGTFDKSISLKNINLKNNPVLR